MIFTRNDRSENLTGSETIIGTRKLVLRAANQPPARDRQIKFKLKSRQVNRGRTDGRHSGQLYLTYNTIRTAQPAR